MTFATAFDTDFDFLAFMACNKLFIVYAFGDGCSEPGLGSTVRLAWEIPRYLFGCWTLAPDIGFVLHSGNIMRGEPHALGRYERAVSLSCRALMWLYSLNGKGLRSVWRTTERMTCCKYGREVSMH